MRVRARDRFWAGQLAQNVMAGALARCRASGQPFSRSLAPHANRGYAHGRTSRTKRMTPRLPGVASPVREVSPPAPAG